MSHNESNSSFKNYGLITQVPEVTCEPLVSVAPFFVRVAPFVEPVRVKAPVILRLYAELVIASSVGPFVASIVRPPLRLKFPVTCNLSPDGPHD